jgi:2-polyprenyl-3-methyl-5-hydroxy-6-metoxy-1,4-benzoquinol methylase
MISGGSKRTSNEIDIANIQSENRKWWTENPMNYNWDNSSEFEPYTNEWFDEADKLFVYGARLFGHSKFPFDNLIPFENLNNKNVLEIGCGIGYHSELLSSAGAKLTSIDISDTSIMATKKRFKLRGLKGDIKQMDAVKLDFPDNYFDFVWSWGVIHHSSQTALIIKEISRVLKSDTGESRIMVYNLNGMSAYFLIMNYLFNFWRGKSLDDCLWKRTDGFMARYYTSDIFCDIFRVFFKEVEAQTFGQDVDGIPLPRKIRNIFLRFYSENKLAKLANKRGGFLFVTAKKVY